MLDTTEFVYQIMYQIVRNGFHVSLRFIAAKYFRNNKLLYKPAVWTAEGPLIKTILTKWPVFHANKSYIKNSTEARVQTTSGYLGLFTSSFNKSLNDVHYQGWLLKNGLEGM
jgi:hypothetical protein